MQARPLPEGLPRPDADTETHSRRVLEYVKRQIELSAGAITFGEYMHHALYAPDLGYYTSGSAKFGEGGDFVTAPEIAPLFARVLARQCLPVLACGNDEAILEFGAGSGILAAQLLERLAEFDALPARYQILEVSAELRARQRETLRRQVPRLLERVQWLDELPRRFRGVVVANEVADALPLERFRIVDGGVEQQFVIVDSGSLSSVWRSAQPTLRNAVSELGVELAAGFEGDINLSLKPWVSSLLDSLDSGLVLLFDYGLSRKEYYAQDRSGGWLQCHFRHRAHSDPLVLPGAQDITGWVDFTAVAEAATAAGAAVAGYVTQTMFLLHGGVDAEFAALTEQHPEVLHALAGQLKILTLPAEMGENFKCIGLTKGSVPVVSALAEADRSAAL